MPANFLEVVTEISLATEAWASSVELRQYFGGNVDRFLRYRLAAIHPAGELPQMAETGPLLAAPKPVSIAGLTPSLWSIKP